MHVYHAKHSSRISLERSLWSTEIYFFSYLFILNKAQKLIKKMQITQRIPYIWIIPYSQNKIECAGSGLRIMKKKRVKWQTSNLCCANSFAFTVSVCCIMTWSIFGLFPPGTCIYSKRIWMLYAHKLQRRLSNQDLNAQNWLKQWDRRAIKCSCRFEPLWNEQL